MKLNNGDDYYSGKVDTADDVDFTTFVLKKRFSKCQCLFECPYLVGVKAINLELFVSVFVHVDIFDISLF